MPAAAQLVVGTAGHIDHGKSRLVWSLTGTNPDRLPEERARGMTIDLGFAHATLDACDIYFVDVPGHERFIRNMVAGATGVDVAALIVAADDSIMPQTREHAELLGLLGMRRCVVVLTKMDLVDDEWAAAVEDEVRGLLASVGVEPLGVVRTSATTGRGLDELRALLVRLARERQRGDVELPTWFRLPIDRAFTVAGRGTVVTGSVAHGAVRTDDELELWPAGRRVRVRDLQSHSVGRDAADGRMRLAVNLAGVALDEVQRGCELATPGYLHATTRLDVQLALLRMPGRERRRELRLRMHIATSEVLVRCRLLREPQDDPLRGVFAQLRTATPIVATHGQRFILRDEGGSRTLGGGVVLRPVASTWTAARPPREEGLAALLDGLPRARLDETARGCAWEVCSHAALAARAGLPDAAAVQPPLRTLGVENRVIALGDARGGDGGASAIVHAAIIGDARGRLLARLAKWLAENPRAAGLPRGEWGGWMPRACPPRLRPLLAEWFVARGHVVDVGGFIVPKGHASALSSADRQLFDAIIDEFEAAAFQTPDIPALKCAAGRDVKRVRELIDLAIVRGHLVKIIDGMWLSAKHAERMARIVADAIRARGPITVADIRTLLDSTRKYVVPFAEFLDASGVTKRSGDVRGIGPSAPAPEA